MEHRNLLAAYKVANDNTREVFRTLHPEIDFEGWLKKEQKDNLPITDRIKTFDDAVAALGEGSPLVEQYVQIEAAYRGDELAHDLFAYLKLRIVCAALNKGKEPQFTEDEVRWYPWHCLYTQSELDNMSDDEKQERSIISTENYQTDFCGFGCAYSLNGPSDALAYIGSRICFKSRELAIYAGRQFIELYADFNLIRK